MNTVKYNAEYASEVMTTIPIGYIDKTVCGCGISSLALENTENIILVVPSIELIRNKIVQYPNSRCSYNLLGVYSDVSKEEIENYLISNKTIKIMVTYDSLYKVEYIIKKYNCKLIIDESNKLLSSTSLKSQSKGDKNIDTITEVFNIAEKYKDIVSFVSATPTPLEYLPKWVSTIPYIRIEWENTTKAKPILLQRRSPDKTLLEEIILPLKNSKNSLTIGNATFSKVIVFINSVSSIMSICKAAELSVSDVGVIVGNSLKNDLKLKKYKRLENPTKLPKFTFVTSAGFEGIDLEDIDAISVVISKTKAKYQMIDMLTDLKQAISRQRLKNNPNYDKFIYIYNQSIVTKSEKELLLDLDDRRASLQTVIDLWEGAKINGTTAGFERLVKKDEDFNIYSNFYEATRTYKINENLFNADKYFILTVRNQYSKGFDIKSNFTECIDVRPTIISTITYSDMVDIYNKTEDLSSLEQYRYKTDYYDLISDSVRLYNKTWKDYTYAKKMVNNSVTDFDKLKLTIKKAFKLNHTYSSKEIKTILAKIYNQFEISKTPKANDLNEFSKLKSIKNKPSGFQIVNFY